MTKYKKMLSKKASQSISKYKVSALALSKRGNIIGKCFNKPSPKPGNIGCHAESRLILRYGRKIKTILIYRVNQAGIPKPIDPCPMCSELARRFNIDIITIK